MSWPIIAIGLESADPALLEHGITSGYLPNLADLYRQGAYGRLSNVEHHVPETEWTTFLTGCLPQKTGYWRPLQFCPATYDIGLPVRPYDFEEYPPFYALGPDRRVAVFDMPQTTLSDQVNGLQVLAWGSQDPQVPSTSQPASLLSKLTGEFGRHPAFMRCFGDNWWDQTYLKFLLKALKVGLSRRSAIYREMLQQEPWDLFLTVLSESHSAGHNFWHLSRPDPTHYGSVTSLPDSEDPLLEVFQAIDQTLGEVLAQVPESAYVLVFSTLGMDQNSTEVPSMLFLGELLYRFSFGQAAIAPGHLHQPPPPPIQPNRSTWSEQVWQLKYDPNWLRGWLRRQAPGKLHRLIRKLDRQKQTASDGHSEGQPAQLGDPQVLADQGMRLAWQPASWYRPLWPQMQAFALPSFSDGFIRINLQGREAEGIVPVEAYDDLCQQLTHLLYDLKNARSGQPLVQQVIRTRKSPMELDPHLPDADLVVVWGDRPCDVADSPTLGRIGPVPMRRSGGHRPGGFLLARGPGIQPGTRLPPGHAVDLPATILSLMGEPIPSYYDGKPLL